MRIPREGERVARPGADLYAVLGISTSVGLAVVGWETNMRLKYSIVLVATECKHHLNAVPFLKVTRVLCQFVGDSA